jgi:hypothetical protein
MLIKTGGFTPPVFGFDQLTAQQTSWTLKPTRFSHFSGFCALRENLQHFSKGDSALEDIGFEPRRFDSTTLRKLRNGGLGR